MDKSFFVQGAISPDFISKKIAAHQSKTKVGAHQIFLGQVRADVINKKVVSCIDYTAYEEMANKVIYDIKESAFAKFNIHCLHIYHSLGEVKVGEISLFVFVSSAHRIDCFNALPYLVNEIKEKAPIFGKEIFEPSQDGAITHQWKTNQ